MSNRTNCCKTILFALALLAVAVMAVPAFGQTCLQDEYNAFAGITPTSCTSTPSSNKLNCTANDVSISQIPANTIHVLSGGPTSGPPSCFQGATNLSFTADFDILTTANAANSGGRDNVGLYLATKPACAPGQTTNCNPAITVSSNPPVNSAALCGSCFDSVISPLHDCGGLATGTTCGSDIYRELDTGVKVGNNNDNCGDTSSTDTGSTFGTGHQGDTIFVQNMTCGGQTCTTSTGGTGLLLNYCTSWQTSGSIVGCYASPPDYLYSSAFNGSKPEAVPGTKSKCNCSNVCLPITPINPSAKTAKACNTPNATPSTLATTGTPTPDFSGTTGTATPNSCDAGVEGSTATYTVFVQNTTGFGGVQVDQICDSYYGTIYDDNYQVNGTRAFPVCPAGTTLLHGATNGNCPPAPIAQNASDSCTFSAPVGEATSVSDIVTTAGHSTVSGQGNQTFSNSTSNSVTVHSEEAPSTATVTKGFVANTNVCVTVRYSVDVANTSGFDENLTLSGLQDDSFGDITKWTGNGNAAVLGTTCGVAAGSAGLGSLSGVTVPNDFSNGGALPTTSSQLQAGANSVDYKCQFDATFCGPPTTVNLPNNATCSGISHSNTVSASILSRDDSETGTCTSPVTGATVPCLTEADHGLTVDECITTTTVSN
jgi:hypothetical protein